jgi:hypothetical protein
LADVLVVAADGGPEALVPMDPVVHRTLVLEHGWTRTEYADWIERAAVAELLEGTDAES